MDAMKQAIRENRRGKVAVATFWLFTDDHAPEIAILHSRMEVCEKIGHPTRHAVWFIGYSPEFDALELGQHPPEYEAIFTHDDDGPALDAWFAPRPRSALPGGPDTRRPETEKEGLKALFDRMLLDVTANEDLEFVWIPGAENPGLR